MKPKNYRLQTVLEIRSRAKDEAAKLVALRLQQLEQTILELKNRQKNLEKCFEKQNQATFLMNEEINKGLQTKNILQHRNFLDDLRKLEIELKAEVEKQKKVVENAEKDLENARQKLIDSARDLKAIETHKTNWQTAERTKRNLSEQKISDEIGAILHGRRKSTS